MPYIPRHAAAASSVDLSFIIPVRNDAEALERCLRSLRRASDAAAQNVECIVVDNGSHDNSAAVAARAGCQVLIVPGERVGALRNRGAEAASGALLAFVDADHEITSGWVDSAFDAMADSTVSSVGALCQPPVEANWVQRAYDGLRSHDSRPQRVEWLGSGNMVVRRDVFRRIGGFDVTLESCEDVDLCRRIRRAGGVILSDPRLGSIHYGDPASLTAVFRGELWRGRNNLRVSLRETPSLRSLPGILIPLAQLALLGAILGSALAWRAELVAAGAALFALPSVARALRMRTRRVPGRHALAVAFAYDAARALALLTRVRHRRATNPVWMPSR